MGRYGEWGCFYQLNSNKTHTVSLILVPGNKMKRAFRNNKAMQVGKEQNVRVPWSGLCEDLLCFLFFFTLTWISVLVKISSYSKLHNEWRCWKIALTEGTQNLLVALVIVWPLLHCALRFTDRLPSLVGHPLMYHPLPLRKPRSALPHLHC